MMEDIEKLLAYGRMGLETGQYEQAREDFEKVLALDPDNREAMKGLARVYERLSRKEAAAVEPIQDKLVEAPHKAEPKWSVPEKEKKGSGLRTGAMVLGIIGGLAGIAGSFFALLVGGLGTAFGAEEARTAVSLGCAAIPLSLLGIVGGAIAKAKPTAAGILMLISGIGGFIAIFMGYIIAGPLLVVGGILALLDRKESQNQPKGRSVYVLAAIVVSAVVLTMAWAALDMSVGTTPQREATRAARATPTKRPTPKFTKTPAIGMSRVSPAPVGQPVVADNGIELTVLGLERNAWSKIREMNPFNPEPQEGMEYVIVTLRARNLGDSADTQTITQWHFRVVGERGVIYDPPFVLVLEKGLTVELFGGGTTEGQVGLQVGQGEKNLVLIYDPGLGSTARYLSLGNSQKRSAATATPIPSRPTQPITEIMPTPTFATLPAFCDTVTEIPQVECQALVVLYNSTNGANWNHNDGWLQTNTPCSWYGVKCQGEHVTELNMLNNHLAGTMPSELGNLSELQVLDFWGNGLTGNIPSSLGSLTHLRKFRAYGNILTGDIPPELGNLIYLQNLTLSTNRLSGNIPPELSKLVNLQELHLHSNQLSGGVPPELGNLVNLRKLHIANNSQLGGPLPKSLMKLNKLSFFYYWGTKLCAPADAAFQT